jgi:hypothetical protein
VLPVALEKRTLAEFAKRLRAAVRRKFGVTGTCCTSGRCAPVLDHVAEKIHGSVRRGRAHDSPARPIDDRVRQRLQTNTAVPRRVADVYVAAQTVPLDTGILPVLGELWHSLIEPIFLRS